MIIWMTQQQAQQYQSSDAPCPLCQQNVPIVTTGHYDAEMLRNIGKEIRNTDKGIAIEQQLRRIADQIDPQCNQSK